ncbi:MAG: GTP cyclohydrolase I FolE2 [Armatimonadetes bacterium]|nr:GTP cyclohydrolase I FolE2 [Armatimonadota bacterium]MBS1703724.1 GTP cyclohydrolase I FolE2 [Armatimonadota bacterium]MBS1726098.1 GTP cyclohydrolase I FolE2 [Armatimonadota bacterium]
MANLDAPTTLVDIQSTKDNRNISIDKVGVRKVKYPMSVRERDNGTQRTVGEFTLTVDLPHDFKGTHMSRFLEILGEHSRLVSGETIPEILTKLRDRLKAETAHLEVKFTLFRAKAAPVTGKEGMMGYECGFVAAGGKTEDFWLHLVVPVTTLCPCSKEISEFGAHNQRGYVTVKVKPDGMLWLEDVIDMIEKAGSAPLYPVLKRPDEKFVTEQAYQNPRFVEDMVREVALAFDADDRIVAYEIEVENHESIHDHNAYAFLARSK